MLGAMFEECAANKALDQTLGVAPEMKSDDGMAQSEVVGSTDMLLADRAVYCHMGSLNHTALQRGCQLAHAGSGQVEAFMDQPILCHLERPLCCSSIQL